LLGSAKLPASEARLKRLVEKIKTLAQKDEQSLRRAEEVNRLRLAAAGEIYGICAGFVQQVNELLGSPELTIDPADFCPVRFDDNTPCLIQINLRGRILQVEFSATVELVSTEDFRVPYTMAGAVRAFNQELLEKDLIEEQLLFFTLEREGGMWRFFDARTYRSGPFNREYLTGLLEHLV
jgi:hypothetical protein